MEEPTDIVDNSEANIVNPQDPIPPSEGSGETCDCEQIPTSVVSQRLFTTKKPPPDVPFVFEGPRPDKNEKLSDIGSLSSMVPKKLRCEAILSSIEKDLKVADLKLSSYMTACLEIKNGLQIHPFPPTFCSLDFSNQRRLFDANEEIPNIIILKRSLEVNNYDFHKDDVINTLFWLFVSLKDPEIKMIPIDEFPCIVSEVFDNPVLDKPSYIYSLQYADDSRLLRKWETYKGEYTSKFAFMYLDPEYLHTLLHEGLRFIAGVNGPGVILCKDLNYVVDSAPDGWYWSKSTIGSKLKVICLVEFLDHPSVLIQKKKKCTLRSMKTDSNEEEKFSIITDPTTAVVRYVMIYTKPSSLGSNLLDQKASWFRGKEIFRKISFGICFVLSLMASMYSAFSGINWVGGLLKLFKEQQNFTLLGSVSNK